MAETLKKYDWDQPSHLTKTEKATYPWDEWLDGNIWKLTQGEDFFPHPLMMERIIRTRATGRGAKIRMRHEAASDSPRSKNPFGIIILQRTDTPTNGKAPAEKAKAASKAPAKKATPAKASAAKAPAKKAVAKAAAPAKAAPAKKAAPVKAATPSKAAAPSKKATPAKAARGPRTVKVDGPAPAPEAAAPVTPAPSKKAAKKVEVDAA